MNSALFVDFDNIYSCLQRIDPVAANRFASQPVQWLDWLCVYLESTSLGANRRINVRRCYLNPQVYQRYRNAFLVAGFDVLDCPPLTSGGKTSTDVHMILDAMDLIYEDIRYDEFLFFSGDADFTPVLRRLRRKDRRTGILAIGYSSAAYRASADCVIDQGSFISQALDVQGSAVIEPKILPASGPSKQAACQEPSGIRKNIGSPPKESRMAAVDWICKTISSAKEPMEIPSLAWLIRQKFPGLEEDGWGGFGSFKDFLSSEAFRDFQISWDDGGVISSLPGDVSEYQYGENDFPRIASVVFDVVAMAGGRIDASKVAAELMARFPGVSKGWAGKSSFKRLVNALDLRTVRFVWGLTNCEAVLVS